MTDARQPPPIAPSGIRRVVGGYIVLGVVAAVAIGTLIVVGSAPPPAPAQAAGESDDVAISPGDIAGRYQLSTASSCLGGEPVDVELEPAADGVTALGIPTDGPLGIVGEELRGDVRCIDGESQSLVLVPVTEGRGPRQLVGTLGGAVVSASPARLSGEETFGRLMLAIGVVILSARSLGALVARIGQPRVMGEVLAGILLGPSLVGLVAPSVQAFFFPPQIQPLLVGAADIGLAFYMFLVGLELDARVLKGRVAQAAFISNASVVVPMALGIFAAVFLYESLGVGAFIPFALFVGVSMSITAFPVLARILVERRMLSRPVGAVALASAAVDDVTAWGLLALASAAATTGDTTGALRVLALAAIFTAVMALLGRRLLRRVSTAYDEAGHVSPAWIAIIFVGVLFSAYAASAVGIAAIFGAFVMGMIMPKRADLTHEMTERVEPFVVTVLLPLFFVVTGLRTQVGLLDRPELLLTTLALIALAVVAKWATAMVSARFVGYRLRESAAIGALMNTRGLTELIVLNVGLELGIIGGELFTMLVIMALATTLMTGPALRLLDPRGSFSAQPEEEMRAARAEATEAHPTPARAILVAPLDSKNLDALLAIAAPLALSEPRRELILVQTVSASRVSAGLAGDERALGRVAADLRDRSRALRERGIATRAVTFTTAAVADDLLRIVADQSIDLLLLDGHRPVFGAGVPGGPVGELLSTAPCDVAVLIERGQAATQLDAGLPIVVAFGGADHDWAALELAAWLAASADAPLRLLGAAAHAGDGSRDASRLLASASLAVQQLTGVQAEPVLVEPGRDSVLAAAEGAALLVLGLSERWKAEGLGPVRSAVAEAAPAPTIFVRRGARPGVLAPTSDMTRFTWSSPGRQTVGAAAPDGATPEAG